MRINDEYYIEKLNEYYFAVHACNYRYSNVYPKCYRLKLDDGFVDVEVEGSCGCAVAQDIIDKFKFIAESLL